MRNHEDIFKGYRNKKKLDCYYPFCFCHLRSDLWSIQRPTRRPNCGCCRHRRWNDGFLYYTAWSADFLKKLDADDSAFNEYIARKNAVFCKHPGDKWFSEVRYQCQLCEYLHTHRNDITQVPDVLDFWKEERRCTKAADYYKGAFDDVQAR